MAANEFIIEANYVTEQAKRRLSHVKGGFQKALVGAINRTGREVKTWFSREIRQRIAVKKKHLDPNLKFRRATKSDPVGVVVIHKSARLSLKEFGLKQLWGRLSKRERSLGIVHRRGAGVSYKIEKGGKRKKIKEAFGADESTWPKLHGHAFKRRTKKRYPIDKLHGASPWGVVVSEFHRLRPKSVAYANERLLKNIEDQVRFRLLRAEGKA